MRRTLLAALTLATLTLATLTACQMTPAGAPTGLAPTGLVSDSIAVTPLDAPAATAAPSATETTAAAGATTPHPKPRPEALAAPAPDTAAPAPADPAAKPEPPAEPEAPRTAEQLLCEKTGGQWASAGETGAFYCAKPTRDGGKQCRKKTECQGACLARSGTCAPVMPLYGCNEVLEKDGRRVTLCID